MKCEKAHLSQDLISQFNPQLLPHSHLNLEGESQFNLITLGHQVIPLASDQPIIKLHLRERILIEKLSRQMEEDVGIHLLFLRKC